jgi:MoxR-like ATPase
VAKSVALHPGDVFQAVFWRNEGEQSNAFPFRATHVNGVKSNKVILCANPSIPPGRPVRARVTRVKRPQSEGRGFIEAEYLGQVVFELDPEIYVDKQVARKLHVLLEAGYSILLDGPQGSGKTVLSRSIAQALDMEYVYFNCASVYEATDFIATLQVRASEKGVAETVFLPTEVCLALQRSVDNPAQRYLIFMDEFNRCRSMARNGLMPALDSTRKVYDPSTNTMLDIPTNVQFCAAINNGEQFVGTTAVDPAQMDRFATLKIDYPPAAEERKILARRFPGVQPKVLDLVVGAANAVRSDDNLGVDLSMRATEEACVMLSHPYFMDGLRDDEALHEVLKTAFCGRFPGRAEDDTTDAGAVWQVVLRALRAKK